MKSTWALVLLLCLPFLLVAQQVDTKIFPYKYSVDDLPNGLRLVTIPTDYPNMVALYIVVRTGSRNEVEPGKSGYAHLFEHLMFRGSENYTAEQQTEILKRAGAESNAYTTLDRTVFYETFTKEDLDEILKMEADKFQRLKYSESAYKTETLAVLGEFNKNSSEPANKLSEVMRATAFKNHTYGHTTMGFIKDVEDMPNQYNYSLQFFQRYYRPEYVTITITGDVSRDQVLELTRKYFGDWKRGNYVPQIPVEPPQTEPRSATIDWPSPTLPMVSLGYHGPAYSDTNKEKAALDLFGQIAFGPNSDFYQKLILKEQKVDGLGRGFGNQIDSDLFTVTARVKDVKDVDYVRNEILGTFTRFTDEVVTKAKLDATRSRMRYSFALGLDSSTAIAEGLAPYIALTRTPDTINKLYELYQSITPEDIRAAAAKYFVDTNRTTVTLTYKPVRQNQEQN
jgi:zinc protease